MQTRTYLADRLQYLDHGVACKTRAA